MYAMKKSLKFLTAGAAILAAALSCTQEQTTPTTPQEPELVTLNFVADNNLACDTKTVLNADNSVSWSATGEKISVYETSTVGSTTTAYEPVKSSEAVIDSDGKATFAVTLEARTGMESFSYYAVYPSTAAVNNDDIPDKAKIDFQLSTQTPTLTSYDPKADLLIAKPIILQEQKTNESFSLEFARLIALGKMTIIGLEDSEIVTNIRFAAEGKILTGRSSFDLSTGEVIKYGYSNYTGFIDLEYDENIGFTNNNTAYFTCFPISLKTGDTFTVTVKTTGKNYKKTISIPEGKSLDFTAGASSRFTVDLSNSAEATDVTYEKVTTATDATDWSGEYLIVYEGANLAFDGSLTKLDAVHNNFSVTISDNKISTNPGKAFTIAKEENGYSIKAANGKYIGRTSNSNGFNDGASGLVHTIKFNDDGSVDLISSAGPKLRFNNARDQQRFRYYKSGQGAIHLYKLVVE